MLTMPLEVLAEEANRLLRHFTETGALLHHHHLKWEWGKGMVLELPCMISTPPHRDMPTSRDIGLETLNRESLETGI